MSLVLLAITTVVVGISVVAFAYILKDFERYRKKNRKKSFLI
nr:hypothetical protein KUHPSE09_09510 [Staphylococcus epidermidis]